MTTISMNVTLAPATEVERPGFDVETMVGLVTGLFALGDVPLDTTDPRFKEFGDKAGHIACRIDEILDLDIG